MINPGTGPVADATYEHATQNIKRFVDDLRLGSVMLGTQPSHDRDGRFAFTVAIDSRKISVMMPGLPLEQVRYYGSASGRGNDGQLLSPWAFPRLYIDGSSWLWEFAVNVVRQRLDERYDHTSDSPSEQKSRRVIAAQQLAGPNEHALRNEVEFLTSQLAELRAAVVTLRGVETHLRMATNQRHAGYKHSGHWHAADIVARVLTLLPPSTQPPPILPPTKP